MIALSLGAALAAVRACHVVVATFRHGQRPAVDCSISPKRPLGDGLGDFCAIRFAVDLVTMSSAVRREPETNKEIEQ